MPNPHHRYHFRTLTTHHLNLHSLTHSLTHSLYSHLSLTPDGQKDPTSLHGSCPTLKGEKWSATKWIHVAPFGGQPPPKPVDPNGCEDTHPQCAEVRDYAQQQCLVAVTGQLQQ